MNFQPAPRLPQPPEHQLRPEHEEIIGRRQELNNFKIPGHGPLSGAIAYSFGQTDVTKAAVVVETQTNIPLDKLPTLRKVPTAHKSYQTQILWGSTDLVRWEQDPAFVYIPCYSRYVYNNKTGEIKNGYTGASVGIMNSMDDVVELIPDSRSQKPYATRGQRVLPLVCSRLPKNFIDYGMGNCSHRQNFVKNENGELVLGFTKSNKVTIRNNIDGLVSTQPSFYEFLATKISDFNQAQTARTSFKELKPDDKMVVGDYTLMLGEDVPSEKFGPMATGGMGETEFNSDFFD